MSANSSIAFLFPGQGSQAVGMGKDLYDKFSVAKRIFEEADSALGYPISQLCFEGPEDKLKLTEITQPAILTVSIAAQRVLAEKGITPQFVAGHSLGEYSAHVCVGTLKFSDAVRLVRNRGKYMQDAVPVGVGAMAAILALPIEKLQPVCEQAGRETRQVVSPANVNSPDQIVISGNQASVKRAAELAKEAGAKRAVMLPVSAPFHCSLMKPAQDNLAKDLAQTEFANPHIPVICNVDATVVSSGALAREKLIQQVTGAVQWVRSIETLIANGVNTFIEVGPGKVLSGLMRQIDRSKTVLNIENSESLEKLLAQFAIA
jgi:[acyl-carrier-protein] S-malonyltransferase